MAKKKERSLANGEQGVIPELAPTRIQPIHNAAKRLHQHRDARIASGKEEKAASDHLLNLLNEHELDSYCYGDLRVFRDRKEKVKVQIGTETPAEPEGDDDDGSE